MFVIISISASDFSRYSYSLGDALKEGIRKATVGGATGGVFWLLIFCIFALAFWYGAKLTRDDCLDPGAILQVCHILVKLSFIPVSNVSLRNILFCQGNKIVRKKNIKLISYQNMR